MQRLRLWAACFAALAWLVAGCDDVRIGTSPPPAKKVVKKVIVPRPKKKPPPVDASEELAVIDQAFRKSHAEAAFSSAPEEQAVRRVTGEIERYVEVGPTLVVWLVDRTRSAQPLASAAVAAAARFYQSENVQQWAQDGEQPLLTAVAALDDKVELLLDPPSDQPQAVRSALDRITQTDGGRELTLAAVKQLLDRYEPLRAQRRQIVIVLISDETASDGALLEEVTARLKKEIIPVYAVGYAAPWGQANPFRQTAAGGSPSGNDGDGGSADAWPTYGPESVDSERVHLPVPASGFGFRSAEMDDLVESGYGPFEIERLCRAGGGAFLAVRPSGGSFARFGETASSWPTGAEARFDPEVVSKYRPDYVSEAEYKQLLAESKSRQALHEAARLGRADVLDSPDLSFAKAANEAQMKRQLDSAQQASARVAPQLDRLYETLLPGEADRDQLTGARWQAQFDYALGRVLAAKARNDGYNQMIAALKAGKGPKDVSTYVLEPAESYETSSALKKMADKAKLYLERVVEEHPGTPWAKFAEEDLKVPMGWKWQGT